MLEIILLIVLCRSMGKLLRGKGRNPLLLQILVVVSWFGGELAGGIAAGVMHFVQYGDAPFEPGLSAYLLALAGAAMGAGFWFLIAFILPPAGSPMSFAQPSSENAAEFQVPNADPTNPYSPPRTRQ